MKYTTTNSKIWFESSKCGSFQYFEGYYENDKWLPGNKPVKSIKKAFKQVQEVLNKYPNHEWEGLKANKEVNAEIYFQLMSAITRDNEK